MDFTGQLTVQGQALLSRLLTGGTLTITRVMAGCGITEPSAGALAEPRQTATISDRTTDGSLATVMVTLAAAQAESVYTLTELGVYARDGAGAEILYQVYRLDQPVEISPDSRLVIRTYLRLAFSDDLKLSLSLPPSGLLVEEDVRDKADLVGGQVPYHQMLHLTRGKNLYVDAAAGDDANDGAQTRPFRTIQAAVDALPRDLGEGYVTIYLAEGTYDEVVDIHGFTGGVWNAPLWLIGKSDGVSAAHRVRGLRICNNAAAVYCLGFTVYGEGDGAAVSAEATGVRFFYVCAAADAGAPAEYGFRLGVEGPVQATVAHCQIDGYTQCGITLGSGSVVSGTANTIRNCGVGLQAGYVNSGSCGIWMAAAKTAFSGNTTDHAAYGGSQIFGED